MRRAHFEKDIGLATKRFAFYRGWPAVLEHFLVKRKGVLRFAEFALDGGLFVARRPFELAVFARDLIEKFQRARE